MVENFCLVSDWLPVGLGLGLSVWFMFGSMFVSGLRFLFGFCFWSLFGQWQVHGFCKLCLVSVLVLCNLRV